MEQIVNIFGKGFFKVNSKYTNLLVLMWNRLVVFFVLETFNLKFSF